VKCKLSVSVVVLFIALFCSSMLLAKVVLLSINRFDQAVSRQPMPPITKQKPYVTNPPLLIGTVTIDPIIVSARENL